VHRDLSAANVYYFETHEDGGHVSFLKLGDLEYAKKFGNANSNSSHDVRTVSKYCAQGIAEN
jgi:hypothetical protein